MLVNKQKLILKDLEVVRYLVEDGDMKFITQEGSAINFNDALVINPIEVATFLI